MPIVQQQKYQIAQQLKAANIPSAALEADILLTEVLGVSREYLIAHPEQRLTENEKKQLQQLVARREQREPLSHLLGKREFYSRDFIVTKDTLDPRPDSETIIEAALAHMPQDELPYNILDLGTGTGCLLTTLLAERPHATGTGVDISQQALEVAQKNAEEIGVNKRIKFIKSNWLKEVPKQVYKVIISNPPYIPTAHIPTLEPEVKEYEPHQALDGGISGLDSYQAILSQITDYMDQHTTLFFEIGQYQEADIEHIARKQGLLLVERHKDLAGTIRILVFRSEK